MARPCRAAPARAPSPGVQVVRGADERRVRWRDQRGRRAERVGQEQSRRRAPLGARGAGARPPIPQGRGRHLGRVGEALRPGHGRRHAGPRQQRWAPAGRFPGPRARSPALPQRRERVPPQQAAHPPARPRRPPRWRAPGRQRVPVHRPGHGRPGAGVATRGTASAVRGGGRRPTPRAPAAEGRGAADRVGGEPRARGGHPRRAPPAGPTTGGAGRPAGDPIEHRGRARDGAPGGDPRAMARSRDSAHGGERTTRTGAGRGRSRHGGP